MDGGADVHAHLALSGEPQPPQCFVAETTYLKAAEIAILGSVSIKSHI